MPFIFISHKINYFLNNRYQTDFSCFCFFSFAFLIKQKLKTIPPLWFYIILKHRFSGAFYFNHNGVNIRKKFTVFLLTPTIQCSIIKTERQGDTCHLFYRSFPLCFFCSLSNHFCLSLKILSSPFRCLIYMDEKFSYIYYNC